MFEEEEEGGNIGMTIDLLWENSNPSNNFNQQSFDVTLNGTSTGSQDNSSCVPIRIYGIK